MYIKAVIAACLTALAVAFAACGSSGPGAIVFVSEIDGDPEIYTIQPQSGKTTPLTDNRNGDFEPRWSRDGRRVAFVSDESGDLEINLMDREGKRIERLTHFPGDDDSPRWSPDGGRLAFISNQDGNPEVYVLGLRGDRDGADLKPTRLTSKPDNDRLGDWSPDGEWLAFHRDGAEDLRGIWLRNPTGVNLVHLTHGKDSDPVWSPDGRQITFVRNTGGDDGDDNSGNDEIVVVSRLKNSDWQDDIDTSQLTHNEAADLSPVWSPDSETIAFVSYRDGSAEIYTMRSDGSKHIRLTTNEADDFDPVWSPDGKQIAFVSRVYGASEIFVMEADGARQRRLTNNDAEDYSPDW